MAKDVILEADLGGEALTAEELSAVPDFSGIRKEIWGKFPGAITRKVFQPGEILFREGESGTTAFYLLEGSVEVFINNPIPTTQTRRRSNKGLASSLTKITNYLTGRPDRSGKPVYTRTHIPMDASVDLPLDNPVATLDKGELFGELAALAALKQEKIKRPKFYPRSATVRAKTQVVVFEMLPNILNNVLYNAPAFKDKLNKNYRTRALDNHLRSVPVFRDLSQEFLDYLRERVELVDFVPGQVICQQGEIADAFYLIRLGFVKVSQNFPGGDLVLTYLSRGSYFGEQGLLAPTFRVRARGAEQGQFTEVTLSRDSIRCGRSPEGERVMIVPWDEYVSREHFEMRVDGAKVRVSRSGGGKNPIMYRDQPADSFLVGPGESFAIGNTQFEVLDNGTQAGRRTATCTAMDFVQLVRIKADDFALMREQFPEVDATITEVARARQQMDNQMLSRVQTVSLNSFLDQELMQAQNLLLLDLDKCVRCDECAKACASTHEDGYTRLIREGLRFDKYLVPTSCRACLDPLCMTRCPVGSIRRKETLDIVIEDWCIGCGNCATDCPYGNINVVMLESIQGGTKAEPRPKAFVCDLCAEYPEPNCVRACPHDAAIRVEPKKFFAQDLAGLQLATPEVALPSTPAAPSIPAVAFETRIQSNIANLMPLLPRLRAIGGSRAGTVLQLNYVGTTTFGRSPECDYSFPDDHNMSRAHCSIRCDSGRFFLSDLNSTNGTLVNGSRISEVELRAGDLIVAGDEQFEFLWGQNA